MSDIRGSLSDEEKEKFTRMSDIRGSLSDEEKEKFTANNLIEKASETLETRRANQKRQRFADERSASTPNFWF